MAGNEIAMISWVEEFQKEEQLQFCGLFQRSTNHHNMLKMQVDFKKKNLQYK